MVIPNFSRHLQARAGPRRNPIATLNVELGSVQCRFVSDDDAVVGSVQFDDVERLGEESCRPLRWPIVKNRCRRGGQYLAVEIHNLALCFLTSPAVRRNLPNPCPGRNRFPCFLLFRRLQMRMARLRGCHSWSVRQVASGSAPVGLASTRIKIALGPRRASGRLSRSRVPCGLFSIRA